MARDIISISVGTVASESAFRAGGQVFDQYRCSLKPETLQALICTGDWLRCNFKASKSADASIFISIWNLFCLDFVLHVSLVLYLKNDNFDCGVM